MWASKRSGGARHGGRWVLATVALLSGVLSMAAVTASPAPAGAAAAVTPPISAGTSHTCAVTSAGAAVCWGSGTNGRLGNNAATSSATPVPVQGLTSGVTAIAAGLDSSCAVVSGAAWCWGNNATGQLGNSTTTQSLVPVPVQGLGSGVTAISVGEGYACAVASGSAWCWGSNTYGRLGNNSTTQSLVPVQAQGLTSGVTAISAGTFNTCALVSGGAWCWGSGAFLGNSGNTSSSVPVAVTALTTGVSSISVGRSHTCVVVSGGAKCWGSNTDGALGDGSVASSGVPVQVSGLTSGVTAVAAGNSFSCAVASGAASCWGYDSYGQLGAGKRGDGTAASKRYAGSRVPVAVSGLGSGTTAITAGSLHACAVASGGAASCWGEPSAGKAGNDFVPAISVPRTVAGMGSGASGVSAGSSSTCGVIAAEARCWGWNLFNQVNSSPTEPYFYAPAPVAGLPGVTAVAAGQDHTCALAAGSVSCWGDGSTGQIGNGEQFPTSEFRFPTQVTGLTSGVTALTAGTLHSCAIASGSAKCWGSNGSGRLGAGAVGTGWAPVQVVGLTSGVTALSAGDAHSCAVVSGAAKCWGSNANGRLGNNSTTASSVPVQVQSLTSDVTAIDAGTSHSCAVVSGAAWCWGLNTDGQLGDGTTTPSLVPVQVQGLTSGVTAISAGANHSCAVVSGAVKCWGDNASLQAGGATTSDVLAPAPVSGLTSGATAVSAGRLHSCAEVSGGLSCWGSNTNAQLGSMNQTIPNPVQGGLTFATGEPLPDAPTISGSRSPAANGAGWNNEPVVVSFTCTSTALASCTSPVTVSTDGADQSVTGTATDTASQSASATVSGISIDRVAPTLSGITATAPNGAGWYRAPVAMDWTCADALSGIAPGACPASSSTAGEGSAVSVSASVVDRAGNQTTASSESVPVDLTKPSTGVSSPSTWSNATVTLELTPTDALSGVASTSYRVDGGTTQGGTAPVVSGQGTHTVEFWSVDVAGNEEAHQSVEVRIDVQAPSITASASPAPNGAGWNRTPVTVTFDCGDEPGGSGLASCSAPQSFPSQVDTTATGTATDTAGNTASVNLPVRIDTSAPTISADVPAANANGWFNQPVQVPFSCSDTGGSGIASCPGPVVLAGEGANQPVTGEAVDAAGNTGSASGATVSLDTTAPTISGAAINGSNGNGGYYGDVTVRWTCADALSGVASCPADQVVSGEGSHTVTRSVTDRAGNTTSAEVTIRIDHDTSTDPGFVHGTITSSATGNPVAGATVTLRTTANAVVQTTTTGTDGTYSFPTVPDGTYKLYSVLNKAYQGAYVPGTFTVARGTNRTVDQALVPTLSITGTVRSNGSPVSGATVRVAPSGLSAVSDSAGRYTVTGLLPGSVTVTTSAFGLTPSAPSTFALTADRTLDVALAAPAAGSGVKGTITNRVTGAPLAGATIRVWAKDSAVIGQTITTGADGRYSLASLPVGTYELDVIRVDYQVRWFGDVLSRASATPVPVTTSCASTPDTSWGDPCAIPASIRMG